MICILFCAQLLRKFVRESAWLCLGLFHKSNLTSIGNEYTWNSALLMRNLLKGCCVPYFDEPEYMSSLRIYCSFSIKPSLIEMILCVRSETSGLCVTITNVVPDDLFTSTT